MGIKIIKEKICKTCNTIMTNIDASKTYCDKCNLEKKKKYMKTRIRNKYSEDEYFENFINCVGDDLNNLTTIGFNKISKIPTTSYINYYRITWIDIIKKYNKYYSFEEFIIKQLQECYEKTKIHSKKALSLYNNNITIDLLHNMDWKNIKQKMGLKYCVSYTDEEMKENFLNIKNQIKRVPFYSEFNELTNISENTYADKYKFKGIVYNNIVKKYCSNNEYIEYLKNNKIRKGEIGKVTGSFSAILSLEYLENNFKKIFNDFYNETGNYPTNKVFSKLSKHDDSVYRKRLKIGWVNLCKYYGFNYSGKFNKSEYFVLQLIKNILKSDYTPQKTWSWLKSKKNHKYFCDGYFEKFNLVCEFDGIQHFKPIKKWGGEPNFQIIKTNDEMKNQLLKENNINLIRIKYDEKWHDIKYIKQRLIDAGIQIPY